MFLLAKILNRYSSERTADNLFRKYLTRAQYRRAIRNTYPSDRKKIYDNFYQALGLSFDWYESPEGRPYWRIINNKLKHKYGNEILN